MPYPLHTWLGDQLAAHASPDDLALLELLAGRKIGRLIFLSDADPALRGAPPDLPPWLVLVGGGEDLVALGAWPQSDGQVRWGVSRSPYPGAYGVTDPDLASLLRSELWNCEATAAIGLDPPTCRELVESLLGVQPPAPSAGRDMLRGRFDAGNHAPVATMSILGGLPKPDRVAPVDRAQDAWPEDFVLLSERTGAALGVRDYDAADYFGQRLCRALVAGRHIEDWDELHELLDYFAGEHGILPEPVATWTLADSVADRERAIRDARAGDDPWLPFLFAANLGHRHGFTGERLRLLAALAPDAGHAWLVPLCEARAEVAVL